MSVSSYATISMHIKPYSTTIKDSQTDDNTLSHGWQQCCKEHDQFLVQPVMCLYDGQTKWIADYI